MKRRLIGIVLGADGLAYVHVADPCRVRLRSLAVEALKEGYIIIRMYDLDQLTALATSRLLGVAEK